ncbi:DUF3017 domain-containing protein [Streptomyces sp. NBC_00853]|uniref:DUF3017 domain-containing protein n=1 Tax=Streptomyces sp. NBC_00853 TaxID=2903681 RepID=UPI003873A4A7|nr:DUF3017 domain-containing protein [Streptomyces sp. NBC_00853]
MQAESDAENATGGGAARANGTPVAPVAPATPVAAGPAKAGPAKAGPAKAGPAKAGPAKAGAEAPVRSRRFPSITRDTARPEGSGRAVPGAVSTPARQWPMLSVLTATAVGLLATAFGHPRVGCLAIGLALIAASVMRRVLPSVGMLAVRSRFTDMITYGLLGVAITLLALVMAAPKPWLPIPFMESAVRFTVR